MKTRKVDFNKSKFGLKNLRVNLIRLDRETIERYLVADDKTFNVGIKIRNGRFKITHQSGPKPMTVTISSLSNPFPQNEYSLRARNAPQKNETKNSKPKGVLSEITVSVRKQQLWTACRRAVNASKLIEGSIVFGKQVRPT